MTCMHLTNYPSNSTVSCAYGNIHSGHTHQHVTKDQVVVPCWCVLAPGDQVGHGTCMGARGLDR